MDNEAKACLDEVALALQSNSDAKLAIVGNASSKEKGGKKLATQRAVNTKAYLVGEKGIDSSRIAVVHRLPRWKDGFYHAHPRRRYPGYGWRYSRLLKWLPEVRDRVASMKTATPTGIVMAAIPTVHTSCSPHCFQSIR